MQRFTGNKNWKFLKFYDVLMSKVVYAVNWVWKMPYLWILMFTNYCIVRGLKVLLQDDLQMV